MDNIIDLLKANGPQTGKELFAKTHMNIFALWKACNQSDDIDIINIGSRYLRLDKHLEGLARLSPSILREFCNYSVIGLNEQAEASHLKAQQTHQDIIKISKDKFELAHSIMEKVIESQHEPEVVREKACFLIAGDVAYEMAHLEARPEFSTGKMVNGSDLDIVIIYKDLPKSIVSSIDACVYDKKYSYLCNPVYKEEIDYVIKDVEKVERQLEFDSFEAMVASKVLEEGKFLCGNFKLYSEIKNMVAEFGIYEKMEELKQRASTERENAKKKLLTLNDSVINDNDLVHLFYTTNEREEFF